MEDSTSPFYLLFTLNDPKTGADRVVCTVGSGLVGAVHFEHHLDIDEAGQKAARQIALTTPVHRFTFTSRKALRNVRPYYNERVLAEVRLLVARLSPAQLKRPRRPQGGGYSAAVEIDAPKKARSSWATPSKLRR